MADYRLKENRAQFFADLYSFNLEYRVMPGLVYLYMPELAARRGWDAEERLWFAFLNGMTQNPITSLRMFEQMPQVPPPGAPLLRFTEWFNTHWDTLQFDTDRRHQKADTLAAIKAYALAVAKHGGQQAILSAEHTYAELWRTVREDYFSFGRLSTFSYLEYVQIMGFGRDCDDLMFYDRSGSKSHRNGMLLLLGHDDQVDDKRADNGFDGNYPYFESMCKHLGKRADEMITEFRRQNIPASNFTFESNLCTFKNHFFGRRYPGVYADMAQDRIEWADARGLQSCTEVFKAIRSEHLPTWLRSECEPKKRKTVEKAKIFPATGQLIRLDQYRPERYLLDNTYNL